MRQLAHHTTTDLNGSLPPCPDSGFRISQRRSSVPTPQLKESTPPREHGTLAEIGIVEGSSILADYEIQVQLWSAECGAGRRTLGAIRIEGS